MFNMIVKSLTWAEARDSIPAGRVFEHTDEQLVGRFSPDGQTDFPSLLTLPTVFVQESAPHGDEIARVGTITRARISGATVTLDYAYDGGGIRGIPNKVLRQWASDPPWFSATQ